MAKGRDSALKRPAASNRKSKAKVDKSPAEAKVDKSPAEEPDSKILKRPAAAKPPKKDPKEKDDHESGKKKKVDPKVAGWVRGGVLHFSVLAMSGESAKSRKVEK